MKYDKNVNVGDLMNSLMSNSMGLNPDGVIYNTSTNDICKYAVDHINRLGIPECDHIAIRPRSNKRGELEGFDCIGIFTPTDKRKSNGDMPRNIYRSYEGSNARSKDGRIDLMAYASSIGSSEGGIMTSEEFDKTIGDFAILDRDGNFMFEQYTDSNMNAIGVILDFFSIIEMVLGIDDKTNFEVTSVSAKGQMRQGVYLDFNITIRKYIDLATTKSKSGRNYDVFDALFAKRGRR